MKRDLDIVVAGGGMVGLATAALLATLPQRRSLSLTVVDAGARPVYAADAEVDLRVSAVSAGSLRVLDEIGIGADVRASRACPYRDMCVWDASGIPDGPESLHFSAADVALPELGLIVENSLLCERLYALLESRGVALRFGTAIERINLRTGQAGADLALANGDTLAADLLIGADGAQSAVRDAAAIDVVGWSYSQSAVVLHASPARPHRHTAWQRFLAEGPLALLPLADGRVSIVWSTLPAHAADLLALSDSDCSAALTAASDGVLGALSVAGGRASFPLRAGHARRYVQRGVALVGDAAHTVHPLAGQGANLGLADAEVLYRVLGAALAGGEHPGDLPVLRRYERARRGANATMLHFVDGLSRLFAHDNPWLAGLRGTGLRFFDRSGPLKRRAMRVALGL
ncbi:MAG: UbiH/UbiF/VisC/COQ6 family ubiquinone biosynthesis hydroxylase [Woeseiaceae bacterium]|nr:UbiH/UbiF/VisC/COQ6 family ubiquinone biosynthesis hydroxylase [Woeseiaceae bacterium]